MRWLVLSLALIVGVAQSQENAPTKEERKASTKKSTPKQIGTEARPLVITVQPTEEDKKEAQAREQERKNKSKSDEGLVTWTKVLAWIAGFQFLALLLHAGIFYYQSRKLKQTVGEMRREFISTHRPKLILRDAYATEEVRGERFVVLYTIANVGGSGARIIQSALDVMLLRGGDLRLLPHSLGRNDIGDIRLEPGEQYTHDFVSAPQWVWPIPANLRLWFMGHIVYVDDADVQRHVGIFRCYDSASRRFFSSKNEPVFDGLDYSD